MCGQRVNNRDKGVTELASASLTNVGRASAGYTGVMCGAESALVRVYTLID